MPYVKGFTYTVLLLFIHTITFHTSLNMWGIWIQNYWKMQPTHCSSVYRLLGAVYPYQPIFHYQEDLDNGRLDLGDKRAKYTFKIRFWDLSIWLRWRSNAVESMTTAQGIVWCHDRFRYRNLSTALIIRFTELVNGKEGGKVCKKN